MLKDTNALKKEAADTADLLVTRVNELEDELKGLVTDTKEKITEQVRKFSPSEQVKAHPLPAVGLAAAAGFLVTVSAKQGAMQNIGRSFDKEIGIARNVATAFLLNKLSHKLTEAYPELAEAVSTFKNRALGAETV